MAGETGALAGKVGLVTGGGSGIGAAISRLFAAQGAAVGIADVNAVAASRVRDEIAAAGGEACVCRINVADTDSFAAGVQTVVQRYGRLDVLANNAGIGSQTSGDEPGWWRLLSINVMGVAWGMRYAVEAMRAGDGGSIINTGSHAGLRAARAGVYGASKAAVHTLTRYAALEHAHDRVRVNAVLPGNIYTPIHDQRRHDALVRFMDGDGGAFATEPLDHGIDPEVDRESLIDEFRRIHPMGHLAKAEDIAEAALYFASDASSIVTGNEFLVTGGIMAQMMKERVQWANRTARGFTVTPPARGVTAIVSANDAVVEALTKQLESAGRSVAVSPDPLVTDEPTVRRWLTSLGPLAGIVFAARPDPGGDLFSQQPQDWRDELSADFRVPSVLAYIASDVLPAGGAVTLVTDASGATGAGASPAFCAAAAALTYFTDDLADVLRPRGIRLNTIVAEQLSVDGGSPALGKWAGKEDIAEMVMAVMAAERLTGLQLSLETNHPDA